MWGSSGASLCAEGSNRRCRSSFRRPRAALGRAPEPGTVMDSPLPASGRRRDFGLGPWANSAKPSSSIRLIALSAEAEKLWPHSASVIALTFALSSWLDLPLDLIHIVHRPSLEAQFGRRLDEARRRC